MSERVGAQIERLRTGRGWSRADLERHSGITESTIYRVERGVREPRKTTTATLLAALTRPSEGADGQAVTTGPGTRDRIEDHLAALISHIKTLDGETRSTFIRAVVALLNALEYTRAAASTGSTPDDDRGRS